ncbi:MAG: hypothetical protein FJ137_12515 [Deltaproteobacteria bacterium]|nr:hypothetical protein [Deltaproteobacteria bacterium]
MIRRAPPRSLSSLPAPSPSLSSAVAAVAGAVLVATVGAGSLAGCSGRGPPPTSEPPPQAVTVIEAAAPAAGVSADALPRKDSKRKGVGWYPQVAASSDNRLVLAWVDADRGDVRTATTAPGGSAVEGSVTVVDAEGACGGFLRFSLGPGDAPLFSYVRQDKRLLRVTWRPADRAVMKAAGADVDDAPMPELPPLNTAGTPVAVGQGFVAEEVGYGDQIGRGSALTVDGKGRFALAYYASDDRLRLARRPADLPAFGPQSIGVLEKRDIDVARGSIRVVTDVAVLHDGTVAISYADDVVTDARLRVALLPPGAERATIVKDDDGPSITLDGLMSALHPRAVTTAGGPRLIDVTALDKSERAVFVRTLDVDRGAFVGERVRLVDVDGVAVAARAPAGWLVLARVRGEGGGVFLYVVDEKRGEGDRLAYDVRRVRLGGGGDQDDAWLDVAVRPDGRPAAVWYDAESAALRLYAP